MSWPKHWKPLCDLFEWVSTLRFGACRYYDRGWHLELRSRFWEHLARGLQRQLVMSDMGSEALAEGFLARDIGV